MVYEIKIEGMEFRAAHGCYGVEQLVGGNYLVDITLTVDDGEDGFGHGGGAETDDVSLTVNYVEVYELVREQMAVPSQIIENAALRIADAIRERFPRVICVEVTLSKLAPPLGGKASRVSVTLAR